MSTNPVVITAALNGPIGLKSENPNLPTTPDEVAAAAAACYEAGASVAHLHIRDEEGLPTADMKIARRMLDAVHERCPILTQLSTGVGLKVPYEDRAALVELKPRMASLNVCTMTFGVGEFRNPPDGVRKLAGRMMELGVKAELEIYDTGHLDMCMVLLKEGLLHEPLQFSIVLGVRGGAAATPENLMYLVNKLPKGAIWQVIGVGSRANLQLTAMGMAMGGNARTGLEDTLYIRKGELTDNPTLVKRLVGVAKALERSPATIDETEQMLQLPKTK